MTEAASPASPVLFRANGRPARRDTVATRRAMAVNDAYDRIRRERNMPAVEQPPFN